MEELSYYLNMIEITKDKQPFFNVLQIALNKVNVKETREIIRSALVQGRTEGWNDDIVYFLLNDYIMSHRDVWICLEYLTDFEELHLIEQVLQKFPNVLSDWMVKGFCDPLDTVCRWSGNIPIASLLLRYGENIEGMRNGNEGTALYIAFKYDQLKMADYLIECGAKMPKKGVTPNHVLIRKRRACRDAVMAVLGVFLRRCRFNKNVAINILKPMIWETRLDESWGSAKPPPSPRRGRGEVSQHKKIKTQNLL